MTERGEQDSETIELVVLVCVECGREYAFEGGERPPGDLECGKCGNAVFRRFDAAARPDEVQEEFRDATERDLDADDPAGDATRGDLHDLNQP
ncbi:MAG: hypothetical protein GWM90_01580 [Gemmatimonadetes bacterium]|nr:hypothetical protein [Gemmatimonadota bacterium]NIQ52284.1 hypothetical protein [Gemmatimonadota bacterium]NIU72385.1 hypothetical protein [Gammaproteobacteria bacterium]NIX42864.1 hypothetical protein [Gemmatimonadota bacterium]NIY07041.1 hypothetical protein [Gemmatimonadota bacterium]